eukprot:scaffold426_cov319-Pavlova_lutheri.AAC.4
MASSSSATSASASALSSPLSSRPKWLRSHSCLSSPWTRILRALTPAARAGGREEGDAEALAMATRDVIGIALVGRGLDPASSRYGSSEIRIRIKPRTKRISADRGGGGIRIGSDHEERKNRGNWISGDRMGSVRT